MKDNASNIVIFRTEDEQISVDVRFEDETVWLTQQQLAELFQTSRTNVVEHIKHIFAEGELSEEATCRKFRQVQIEENRTVTRELPFYNSQNPYKIIAEGSFNKTVTINDEPIWDNLKSSKYNKDVI